MQDASLNANKACSTAAAERTAARALALARRRDLTAESLDALLEPPADRAEAESAAPVLDMIASASAAPHVEICVDCPPDLHLAPATLVALGALAAEAIDNAVRHAFPTGREGRVWVKLAADGDALILSVRDNGFGIPDPQPGHDGGRRLIDLLARRLGGRARMGSVLFGGGLVTAHCHR